MLSSRREIDKFLSSDDSTHVISWNLVVITALNEIQAVVFKEKLASKTTIDPKMFEVIPDVPNKKIGNGGSTIHVLNTLHRKYGDGMFSWRILIIHSGGYSQRMPVASFEGKLFVEFPTRIKALDMLDIKLIMLEPFASSMSSGIFITCSDDVVPYNIHPSETRGFGEDFTLFAHITSDMKLATQHGVYVANNPLSGSDHLIECKHVLQKPSIQEMHEYGAIFQWEGADCVLIDSMFSFTHRVSKVLMDWAKNYDFSFEVDSYRDFLQVLGSGCDDDFIKARFQNQPDYLDKLLSKLMGSSAALMVLRDSSFFHLGTNLEYIDNFNCNQIFRKEVCLTNECEVTCDDNCNFKNKSIVIKSHISGTVTIGERSVIDHSVLEGSVEIMDGCIISKCSIVNRSKNPLVIPKETVWQTVSITKREDTEISYITFVFGLHDNLKETFSNKSEAVSLVYANKSFFDFLEKHQYDVTNISFSKDTVSLWNLCLFPLVKGSPSESFKATYDLLHGNVNISSFPNLYSMCNITHREVC